MKKEIINFSTNDLYNIPEEKKTLDSVVVDHETLTDSVNFENSSMTDTNDDGVLTVTYDISSECQEEDNVSENDTMLSNNNEKTRIRHKSVRSFSFNTKDKIVDEDMVVDEENHIKNLERSIFEYKEKKFRKLVPLLGGHNQLDMTNGHSDINYVTPRLNFGNGDASEKTISQMMTIPEAQKSRVVNPLYASLNNPPSNRLSLSSSTRSFY